MYKIFLLIFPISIVSCSREVYFSSQELQKFKVYNQGERFKMLSSLNEDTSDFLVVSVDVVEKSTDAPLSRPTNYQDLITKFIVYHKGVKTGSGETVISSLDKKLLKVDLRVNETCGHYYGFPDLSRLEKYTLNNSEYHDVAVYGGFITVYQRIF